MPQGTAASVVSIDLTVEEFECNDKSHVGFLASALMGEWRDRYPAVLPVCLALKQLLRRRNMGELYAGGLSPYCVLLLLVAFLKHSGLGDSSDAGLVMLEFLDFYRQFNFRQTGIDAGTQDDSPFFARQAAEGVMLIEPVTRKAIKSTYAMLPQILEYFAFLRGLLLSSAEYLEEFRDPRPEIVLKEETNVFAEHCPVE